MDFFRTLLSIIVTLLGVYWQVGFTRQFWFNVILAVLGYPPGWPTQYT